MDILEHLLSAPARPRPIADVDAWWRGHRAATAELPDSAERALAGGFAADRLGYAFASGYVEAMARLVPSVTGARAALCATEPGGNRPRHILARLEPDGDGWLLTGEKRWTTLGTRAERLVVFASAGRDGDRNRIAAVVVPAQRDGIVVTAGTVTPFAPEVPHASISFERVRVAADERLPGDGYDRYLKPFRTIEDCHVQCALIGWLLQLARRGEWPEAIAERLAALAMSARGVARADAASAATHIALAGLIAGTREVIAEVDAVDHWRSLDVETRARWQRDRALLDVAGTARAKRRDVAWQRLRP